MKLFIYDIETTGLNAVENGIHQLTFKIIDPQISNGEVIDLKMCPIETKKYDPEALKFHGLTEEIIKTYPNQRQAYLDLKRFLDLHIDKFDKKDKLHMVGFNILQFDNNFMRQWFKENGDNYFGSYFWADCIDLYPICSLLLVDRRTEMIDFRLGTVCKFMGIEVNETKQHDAQYDLYLTEQLYYKVLNEIH